MFIKGVCTCLKSSHTFDTYEPQEPPVQKRSRLIQHQACHSRMCALSGHGAALHPFPSPKRLLVRICRAWFQELDVRQGDRLHCPRRQEVILGLLLTHAWMWMRACFRLHTSPLHPSCVNASPKEAPSIITEVCRRSTISSTMRFLPSWRDFIRLAGTQDPAPCTAP